MMLGASLIAQSVKNLPAMQETCVWFPGWKYPLEKEMATHSNILAWRIPWTEEPGRLQSMGLQESDMSEWLSLLTTMMLGKIKDVRRRGGRRMRLLDGIIHSMEITHHWLSGVCVGSGSWWLTGKPGVLQSMGSQRVCHDWVTKLTELT